MQPFILISKWFLAIIQKPFCPSKVLGAFCPGKVLGAFCPGITATKIWFFEKPKTKSVLVYNHKSRFDTVFIDTCVIAKWR